MKFLVKEKEDAHADPEIQPMKEDDGTFGEYRWASAAAPSTPSRPHRGAALRLPALGSGQGQAFPGILHFPQMLVYKHFPHS